MSWEGTTPKTDEVTEITTEVDELSALVVELSPWRGNIDDTLVFASVQGDIARVAETREGGGLLSPFQHLKLVQSLAQAGQTDAVEEEDDDPQENVSLPGVVRIPNIAACSPADIAALTRRPQIMSRAAHMLLDAPEIRNMKEGDLFEIRPLEGENPTAYVGKQGGCFYGAFVTTDETTGIGFYATRSREGLTMPSREAQRVLSATGRNAMQGNTGHE